RNPQCVEWTDDEVRAMVPAEQADRIIAILRRIGRTDLMKFRIGMDGLSFRMPGRGDSVVAVVAPGEHASLTEPGGYFRTRLENARAAGARAGTVVIGSSAALQETAEKMVDDAPDLVVVS